MDYQELEALVQRGETAKVDLKAEYRLDVGDAAYRAKKRSDLAWDIAALANTRGGLGYLVVGIDQATGQPVPGGTVGIAADQIQQILTAHCAPPVFIEIETVPWATGEPILVITIPRSDRKPHVVRERGCPTRRGATTDHATHHELLEMAQETGGLDFGRTLVRTASLEDLDPERVARFLADQGQPSVNPTRPSEGVLAGHGLVRREDGQSYPTAGAVLLLGRAPQTHFPQATLSLVRSLEDRADPLDTMVAGGTIIEQIQATERFFRRNLAGDYPAEAFREAVVNALMHRDYAIGWAETSVRLHGDVVEVASPGLLIGGLQVDQLARGPIDYPPRRNPSLVNLFFAQTRGMVEIGALYLERAGSGLNRMRERLDEAGLPAPEFREDEQRDLFVVTLRGVPLSQSRRQTPAGEGIELNLRQRRLLEQLAPDERISAQEYQARFGVSRATASADLAALVRAGLVRAYGSGPGRRYG
ncbi:MAG: putative DNA binding domain-containing protein [Chloroflexi bacterium]|nr:putative DNA binding domain-containing protein [Chloroflexota bacterium]